MALGDLNGDGKADLLAIYDGTGGMYWYPGKGDGTFWSARYINQAGFRHMELADLNGDGKRDLLAIYDGTGGMYWYPGKGDGTFWSARYISQAGFKLMALACVVLRRRPASSKRPGVFSASSPEGTVRITVRASGRQRPYTPRHLHRRPERRRPIQHRPKGQRPLLRPPQQRLQIRRHRQLGPSVQIGNG
jgi:hypothetical protein